MGQHSPHGGLAAARHPDQNHVLQFFLQFTADLGYQRFAVQRTACKILGRIHRLRHQHLKPADGHQTPVLGAQNQLGGKGVVHNIQNRFQLGQRRNVQKALPRLGVHAAGRRVDDDLHIAARSGLFIGQCAVLAGAAGGQNFFGTPVAAYGAYRRMGAACAQNQHGLARKVDAMRLGQVGKARIVGIVAVQLPAAVHHRVDRPDGLGAGVDLVAAGDDHLLIGNGHIDRRKLPFFKKGAGLRLGGQGQQGIGVIGYFLVDDFGIAVSQLCPDQSVQGLCHGGNLLCFGQYDLTLSSYCCFGKPCFCASVP